MSKVFNKDSSYVSRTNTISKQTNDSLLKDFGMKKLYDPNSRKKRIKKFGINKVKRVRFNFLYEFLKSVIMPFNVLLLVVILADISLYFTIEKSFDHIVSAAISALLLFITYTVGITQTYKSILVTRKLDSTVTNNYIILSDDIDTFDDYIDGEEQLYFDTISLRNLTIGDILYFSSGDIVPIDAKVLWSDNLYVNDSFARGSVEKIKKSAEYKPAEKIIDLENIVLGHSTITSGSMIAIVINLSDQNFANHLNKKEEEGIKSFYKTGMKKITLSILLSVFIIFPTFFIATFFSSDGSGSNILISSIVFAITVVISVTPESLPAIIAFNLQYSASKLREKKMLIKNYESIQVLGATDFLISDMSGILTKEKPLLINWIDFDENEKSESLFDKIYVHSFYLSNSFYMFEKGLLETFENKDSLIDKWELFKIKKYNQNRRIGSVLVGNQNNYIQITKGFSDDTLEHISFVRTNNKIKSISEIELNNIGSKISELESKGKFVIVVCSKQANENSEIEEFDLVYEGIMIFRNDVKEDVEESLIDIYKINTNFVIMTENSMSSTISVAERIGIKNIQSLDGDDMQNISIEELKVISKGVNIYANLTPHQKAMIISIYENQHKVVTYLGNGYNDVIALKRSSVGLVSNNSTPISKLFSDIILTEKNLNIFSDAFLIGRKTFINSLKYIKLTLATTFGFILSLLISAIWFPFLPMNSNQLLLITLFLDFANIAFIFDRVDQESVSHAKKWNIKSMLSFMFINGMIPMIISLINLLICAYGFNWLEYYRDAFAAGDKELIILYESKIQTAFYMECFLTKMFLLLILRTEKVSFIKSVPGIRFSVFILIVSIISIVTIYIPYLNSMLGMQPLIYEWWLVYFGLFFLTYILAELFKFLYKYTFKIWF